MPSKPYTSTTFVALRAVHLCYGLEDGTRQWPLD